MYVVVDLGYGDAGKGVTVARLTEPGDLIVKFTGGAQCAHNVRWNKYHHTFSQFGSGMIHPDTDTAIGPDFLFDPLALYREAYHLEGCGVGNALGRITIDPEALVITPITILAGQYRERVKRHGSTGRGIGVTVQHNLDTGMGVRAKDLGSPAVLKYKFRDQIRWARQFGHLEYSDFVPDLERMVGDWPIVPTRDVMKDRVWIGEGSQGILLDQDYGWFPHVTRATTTAMPFLKLTNQRVTIVGVTRTYQTRHGAGPFPTDFGKLKDNDDNTDYEWAGEFKRGFLDIEALRYAIDVQPIDKLVVTHQEFKSFMVAHGEPYEFIDPLALESRADYTKTLYDREFSLQGNATPEYISDQLGVPLLDLEDGAIVNV